VGKKKKGELSGKELDRVDGGADPELVEPTKFRRQCEKFNACKYAGTMGRCKCLNGFPYCGKWPN